MGSKTARIELRADVERAQRIRDAADLSRESVSAFVLNAASQRADQVIAAASVTVAPADWFDAVWQALEAPPSPNPALRARARGPRRVTSR